MVVLPSVKVVLILIYLFGLVAIARVKHPVPSRTRPLSTEALMVLHLKVWKSKSLPGLLTSYFIDAGWSSPVARQAHNLKVAGSNPAPATKKFHKIYYLKKRLWFLDRRLFYVLWV